MSLAPPGSARSPTSGINFVCAQEPGLEFRVLMDDTFVLAVNSDDPVASLHESVGRMLKRSVSLPSGKAAEPYVDRSSLGPFRPFG